MKYDHLETFVSSHFPDEIEKKALSERFSISFLLFLYGKDSVPRRENQCFSTRNSVPFGTKLSVFHL